MVIGDYVIDSYGSMRCRKCFFKTRYSEHKCWESNGRYSGDYVWITAPAFIVTIADIMHANWEASREDLKREGWWL